jgi:4-amino-4-deoxy-L-arabinose transferase-like glycosyltransferase
MSNPDTESPEGAQSARLELIVLALGAVLVGVVTRFVTSSALWLDEALSVNIATLPLGELRGALERDGHPPLYYVLLHFWTEIFGTGDVAVRSLSAVFGLLTIVLVWFLGRRRGGTAMGWILVAVVAVSPFAVRYSNEARMYALVMLLVTVGWFVLDDIVVRGRATVLRFVALAVLTAAMLYTHYWAMWMIAFLGVCALWGVWRDAERRRIWAGVLAALVVGAIAFLPWVPTLLYQNAHTGTPWAEPSRPTVALSDSLVDFGAGRFGEKALVATMLALALVLGLFGRATSSSTIELDLRTRRQVRREAIVVAGTFAIGTGVSFVTSSAFASRYASIVFVLVMVVVAAGLTRFSGRWIGFGAVAVVALTLSASTVLNIDYDRSQARVIGPAIAAGAGPGDVVVVCPDQLGPGLNRTVPSGTRIVSFPDGGDGRFVDWVDYAERNAASDPRAFADAVLAEAGPTGTIWLVWSLSYRTMEAKCAELNAAFAAARPPVDLLAGNGDDWFEHATLTRFAPAK